MTQQLRKTEKANADPCMNVERRGDGVWKGRGLMKARWSRASRRLDRVIVATEAHTPTPTDEEERER